MKPKDRTTGRLAPLGAVPSVRSALLESVHCFVGRGVALVPVAGKEPVARWADATARPMTEAQLASWLVQPHVTGLAAICGAYADLAVLDVEAEGLAWLDRHELPTCPMARSQGGGVHAYFRHGGLGSRRIEADGLHVADLRSDGQIIVVPPSRGPSGDYAWLPGRSLDDIDPPSPPEWLRSLPTTVSSRRTGGVRTGGSRSEADQAAAYRALVEGQPPDAILAYLATTEAARDRPSPSDYAERSLRSAARFALTRVDEAILGGVCGTDHPGVVEIVLMLRSSSRERRLPLDWPITGRSARLWGELADASGSPVGSAPSGRRVVVEHHGHRVTHFRRPIVLDHVRAILGDGEGGP